MLLMTFLALDDHLPKNMMSTDCTREKSVINREACGSTPKAPEHHQEDQKFEDVTSTTSMLTVTEGVCLRFFVVLIFPTPLVLCQVVVSPINPEVSTRSIKM